MDMLARSHIVWATMKKKAENIFLFFGIQINTKNLRKNAFATHMLTHCDSEMDMQLHATLHAGKRKHLQMHVDVQAMTKQRFFEYYFFYSLRMSCPSDQKIKIRMHWTLS